MNIHVCDTHCWLGVNFFNQVNAWLKVETKVYEFPFNALLLVFFLFQYKHVVVEELLEFLIGEVDAQLFE